ncbi:hypothetical protein KBB08_02650 [Candidatus Gracilibacteria bacterium]|nr:hypothetical protein [Candidatus Gracilibacteria bacterium]
MHRIDCGEDFTVEYMGAESGGVTLSLSLGARDSLQRVLSGPDMRRGQLDPACDCVGRISVDGKISRAEVKAFWSDWSTAFLHSADVVLAMSPLVSLGLKPGETITMANSIRFHAPMNNALDVQVQIIDDPKVTQPFAPSANKLCLTASLQTSLGRTVLVQGNDSSSAIPRNRYWRNDLTARIQGKHRLNQSALSVDGLDFVRPFDQIGGTVKLKSTDSTFVLSTVMDAFMWLVVQAYHQGLMQSPGSGVLAGCENLQLPSADDLLRGGTMHMSIGAHQQKAVRKGRLFPVDFQMRNAGSSKVAGGRMNFAFVSEL